MLVPEEFQNFAFQLREFGWPNPYESGSTDFLHSPRDRGFPFLLNIDCLNSSLQVYKIVNRAGGLLASCHAFQRVAQIALRA